LGQPLIEISEPCGKRSFIRSRMLVISLIATVFVCAVSHALDTRTQRRDLRNNAPLPSEAARTILTAKGQVKIATKLATALNWLILFQKIETGCAQLPRCKSGLGEPDDRFRFAAPSGQTERERRQCKSGAA
jgi:hypothetical protein